MRTTDDPRTGGGSEDARSIMSDEFDGLDATEKAGIEAGLSRCRTLVAKIDSELGNKRPEHFDKFSLADLYASLVRAAGVVEQDRRGQARRPSSTDNVNHSD